MKKIYFAALVAVMALCAVVVSSCGDDETPSVDPTPSSTFTLAVQTEIAIQGTATRTQVLEAIISFYKSALKDYDVTFDTSKSDDVKLFYIEGSSSKLDNVRAALSKVDYTTLDNSLKAMSTVTKCVIMVSPLTNTSDVITSHTYPETPAWDWSFVYTTWNYTAEDGTTYALTVTDKKKSEDSGITYYEATLTVNGTPYTGYVHMGESKIYFYSDQKTDDAYKNYIYAGVWDFTDGNKESCTAIVHSKGSTILNKVTFKK